MCFFSPWHVDHRKCCQFSPTDDHRQFITLSVYDKVGVTHSVAQFICVSLGVLLPRNTFTIIFGYQSLAYHVFRTIAVNNARQPWSVSKIVSVSVCA